jgi:hypothetical protein
MVGLIEVEEMVGLLEAAKTAEVGRRVVPESVSAGEAEA